MAEAKIKYVPPVAEYVTATFDMAAVLELVVHLESTAVEFELSDAVQGILEGFKDAYQGDLPGNANNEVEGGATV